MFVPQKKLSNVLIVGLLSSAFVSGTLHAEETCDANLEAGLTIDNHHITFLNGDVSLPKKDRALYEINDKKQIVIAGNVISLSSDQQILVKEYDEKIRQLIPQVKKVAIEGVDLALKGVNVAFDELLGEGNRVGKTLSQELINIKNEVVNDLSIEKGFTVGADGLGDKELLGKDIEQRVESAVKSAMMNSMGHLLVALGQQIMVSDGNDKSFEERMETFGETIESEMALRTAQIEKKSQELCDEMTNVDALEEKLKSSIKAIEGMNVFIVKQVGK